MGPAKKEHNKSARPVKMWSHFFLYFVLWFLNRKKVFSHFYPTRCEIVFFGLTHTHRQRKRLVVNCHWIQLNTLKRLKLKNFQYGRRNYVWHWVHNTSINICIYYICYIHNMFSYISYTDEREKKASRLPGKYESCWQTFVQRLSPVSAVSGLSLSFWPGAVPQPWLKYEIHQGCC